MPKLTIELPTPVEYTDQDRVVSYSEMSSYRQCPLKHTLGYVERWTKPQSDTSALAKGSLWHLVLEHHYLTLMDLQDTELDEQSKLVEAQASTTPFLFNKDGSQTETQELISWMYDGYVKKWGTDPQWRILAVEYKLAEYLPEPEGGTSPFILKAKLDLIVQDATTGGVWIVDHKSGRNLPSDMELAIDDQFGLYTWLLQKRGLKVMGSIHDAARTTRNVGDIDGKKPQTLEQRMSRTYLNRTDIETYNVANDAWAVAVNMYPEAYEIEQLPIYSSPDPGQCNWKCDYKEPHLLARQGRDLTEVLTEYGFVQDFTRH
jgi:hypothetical protein